MPLALPVGLPLFNLVQFSLTRRQTDWQGSHSFRNEPASEALQPYDGVAHRVLFETAPDGADLRFAYFWDEQRDQKRSDAFKGLKILVEGKSCAIEDMQALAHYYARRGYLVLCFDLRSQGLSARLCNNHQKIHVNDFTEYELDILTAIRLARRDYPDLTPQLISFSTGGGAILGGILSGRLVESGRLLVDPHIVLLAPLIRALELRPGGLIDGVTHVTRRPAAQAYMLGHDWDPNEDLANLASNRYTDYQPEALAYIFRRLEGPYRMQGRNCQGEPRLVASDPTIGWVKAAFEHCQRFSQLSAQDLAALAQFRITFVQAADEQIVCNQSIARLAHSIPGATLTTLPCKHAIIAGGPEIIKAVGAISAGEQLPEELPCAESLPQPNIPEWRSLGTHAVRRVRYKFSSASRQPVIPPELRLAA
jgi:lysophospholipase